MPAHPVHPDPEELAAWQAGELDEAGNARIAAHVAGCADCAGMVAAVERGRAALAELAEVELPAALHQRLAGAIERELAMPAPAGAGDGGRERRSAGPAQTNGSERSAPIAEPIPLDGQRRRGRRSPAGRRVAVLSAAAAVILLVAGLVPLLRHVGGQTVATQGAGRGAAAAPAGSSAPGSLPVFSAPGGYSGTALRSGLASDPAVRSAYQRAAGETSGGQPATGLEKATPVTPQPNSRSGAGGAAKGSGGAAESATGLQQLTCVASVQDQAGDQGLRPAFFVNTVYRGQAATVLVTVRPGAPGQADLWVFPRDNCSASPVAHQRVTVSPP